LTTSYAPDRHAAGGHEDVGAHELVLERGGQRPRVVGHDADAVGDGAGLDGGRGQRRAVGVDDLARTERLRRPRRARCPSTRRRPAAGAHEQPGAPDRCCQADLHRAEVAAGAQHCVADGDVLAGPADVGPGRRRLADDDGGDPAVGPLEREDRVGTGRHQRPRHDPHAGAGRHAQRRRRPGRDVAGDRQHDRLLLGRGGDVGQAHGVAVDGGVVEARQRSGCDDVLGEHAPVGVHQAERQR
jgi:hypothetical protein